MGRERKGFNTEGTEETECTEKRRFNAKAPYAEERREKRMAGVDLSMSLGKQQQSAAN